MLKVALIGNPNTGKSTLFNHLTGLSQKTGNFPGVTVELKTGTLQLDADELQIIDLPGIYSLYPKSIDERIALDVLTVREGEYFPDAVILIVDASNLKRNLLLYTQVADLGFRVILALNMIDVAEEREITIDLDALSARLGTPVVTLNGRDVQTLEPLRNLLKDLAHLPTASTTCAVRKLAPAVVDHVRAEFKLESDYVSLQMAHKLAQPLAEKSDQLVKLFEETHFHSMRVQTQETLLRYQFIAVILAGTVSQNKTPAASLTNKIDRVLTHKFFGLFFFVVILFGVFQSIFSLARIPMQLIDKSFVWFSDFLKVRLPHGPLSDLITDGVLAGLSGVVMFLPQIVILFLFISILEDTGYMARVSFMMDRLMRKVGLNGKSVVPMISGVACAVPAIMSTRTIENWKDRLITILVTPLMSCSARLPVYTLLISLVVPDRFIFGFFSLQGLALLSMYLIGFFAAILAAFVLKKVVASRAKNYFIMELPIYRVPKWSHLLLSLLDKSKAFVTSAGKMIIAVSVILWVLASYGMPGTFKKIEDRYENAQYIRKVGQEQAALQEKSAKLEKSFAGILGHAIEPAIRPLGYDWKIGIALITSFAAREVFIGTMATIYSVNQQGKNLESVRQKMQEAKSPVTGKPIFTVAVGFSLMIFYAFAMQCSSTLAVVFRETKSWKWPVFQFAYMTALAYMGSFLVFQLLK